MLFQAVLRPGLELVEVPSGLGDADDRNVQRAALNHRLQRREDLLVGKIAGGAEEDQRVGMRLTHVHSPSQVPEWTDYFSAGFLEMPAEREAHRRQQSCWSNPLRRAS